MKQPQLFDEWPETYDQWFTTPIGSLVRKYESELIRELLNPAPGDRVLDGGCGTGVFTPDFLASGSRVMGLDLSFPMLTRSMKKLCGTPFQAFQGDLLALPFKDQTFDQSVSITALEFIRDGEKALRELFRVTKPGGTVVVATLNRLSPWAERRSEAAKKGHPIFRHAIFRSPEELLALRPEKGTLRTAVHFEKEDPPEKAVEKEEEGRIQGSKTGAFIAVAWEKT